MYLHSIQHLRHKLQTFVLELHQVNLKFSLFHWNHCIDRNEQQHEGQTYRQKDKPPISPRCTDQMLLKPMSNKWSDNHFKMKCLESFIGILSWSRKTGFIEIKNSIHTCTRYETEYFSTRTSIYSFIFSYSYSQIAQLLNVDMNIVLLFNMYTLHSFHCIIMKFIIKAYIG